MATFVYVISEKLASSIRRTGIVSTQAIAPTLSGIHAVPVVPNLHQSYHWRQELKRKGRRNMCGVYFQIPDNDVVWISLYNEPYRATTAAEAVGLLIDNLITEDYRVIIPRPISKQEIRQIRYIPAETMPSYLSNVQTACSNPNCPNVIQRSYARSL